MPVAMLILACALWGVSFPVIKALDLEQTARLPEASKVFLATWLQMARFALAAAIMIPLVARQMPSRREWAQGIWLAAWGGLGMALQAWGLGYTEASTSAFLTQAYCVILPLVACLKTRRAPTARVMIATALVILGGAILSGVRPGELKIGKGEAATLAAAFVFTFQILTLENPKYEGNRGLPVTFAMCTGIAALFLPVTWFLAPDAGHLISPGATWPAFSLVLVLALVCSVGAYSLMNCWQPRVSATEAGLIYTTEPVFTAGFVLFLPVMLGQLVGGVYPNESLTFTLVAGGSLILAANVLMQWKRRPHPPAIAPAP
ncbi:DMT family transporter [Luteolibacter flavescens]|uniref:DMT family transporter n=1 Tax=Luteolibacter flavescens TaxID=1859460 RepID=A0ABT3FTB7_9BACT|nr:DMT family transporter [Luteolibacter flavescens]MCW1886240.1 DMT family transporter [Luteolibacter flavescens]